MSISPIITFKAGLCELDTSSTPPKVKPKPTPGYIYLYSSEEEGLAHFCWRPRSVPLTEPETDLVMVPGDGQFKPYGYESEGTASHKGPTNGRIYVLKFSSSSVRHLFWLQSKSQHPRGDPSWFSPRDLKLGQIVDQLLQGEEVDVANEIANLREDGPDDDNGDEPMEDVEGTGDNHDPHQSGTGGAGPGATGGDIREEGEESREGGADGARAAAMSSDDPSSLVQNFLDSLKGNPGMGSRTDLDHRDQLSTTLSDLLTPTTTIPVIESADSAAIDSLLSYLPPSLLLMAQEVDDLSSIDPTSDAARAAIQALSPAQKKDILRRVLRSPQFSQSLGSLTVALRDGGLPSVSEALNIKVEGGGFIKGSGVPVGGGQAIEAFLEGIRRTVEEESQH